MYYISSNYIHYIKRLDSKEKKKESWQSLWYSSWWWHRWNQVIKSVLVSKSAGNSIRSACGSLPDTKTKETVPFFYYFLVMFSINDVTSIYMLWLLPIVKGITPLGCLQTHHLITWNVVLDQTDDVIFNYCNLSHMFEVELIY